MKNLPKIEQMESSRGNKIPNQFLIYTGDAVFFQSYNTIIAMRKNGKITLDAEKWDYSTTTGKYRNQFLNEGIAETRAKIKAKEYKLADLNA